MELVIIIVIIYINTRIIVILPCYFRIFSVWKSVLQFNKFWSDLHEVIYDLEEICWM